MPKRTDIKKILIIGSGPIVIGQACEFDYSGTQACKALKEEGYRIVLVNSNPATIMTDPEMADRTYIEPITPELVEQIIAKERPDALLPTLGGQTGLNVAVTLADRGVLERYGVQMIGANADVIRKAEDRQLFKEAMLKVGLEVPQSWIIHRWEEANALYERGELKMPVVVRPSFTLGGTGGGIARTPEEFERQVQFGLASSMVSEVLLEEAVIGWKEFELEVMRDLKDNVVIICSIENVDPMGVHTGDSITVAPAQTLTDKEYQRMRDAAIRCIREIGVETGGSNIQFAIHPQTGQMVIIEMNPRVSRSSALASKATGFPIAKIAAKLAVGYTLDEIPNDITKETPASFEPTMDYCVVKIPRWTFEKFPTADPTLTTQMKSVGETMAIGRTFKEALQKGLRSLEIGRAGLGADGKDRFPRGHRFSAEDLEEIRVKLTVPNQDRVFYIRDALHAGLSVQDIAALSQIDPWFVENLREIVEFEEGIRQQGLSDPAILRQAKQMGFSDQQLACLTGSTQQAIRKQRMGQAIQAGYKLVDTCGAEFEARTPYYYSTYETEDESRPSANRKIMILGGGPNRIGQGIEFDYCCVHAAFALKEIGYETIMVNSNPETVSTDYDTSDKLYFEPLTLEDVLNIVDREQPDGVIVQFGGQTPLNLAVPLERAGVPIIGTSPKQIDRAEDRKKFSAMLKKLKLLQPPNGTATTISEAKRVARRIGYPVLLRPSYVLGGRAMELVYDDPGLEQYMKEATRVSGEHPVLIDKFLEHAIEVDVDLVADGETAVIGGILEHIEQAGIHSGDAAMVLPAYSLGDEVIEEIRRASHLMAKELEVVGLMNVQFAVKGGAVYILEVNPRASRTVPFVSKAISVPLAKLAAKVMTGRTLGALGFTREIVPGHISVKESVFPFVKFPGVDIILGPEMKSTGEVMGMDFSFGAAFAKAELAAGQVLPTSGTVFVSVNNEDKRDIVFIAKRLAELGFHLLATTGTAKILQRAGVKADVVKKIYEGTPNILDQLRAGNVRLIINTPTGRVTKADESKIRSLAVSQGIPCITTIAGAQASLSAIEALKREPLVARALQEYQNGSLAFAAGSA